MLDSMTGVWTGEGDPLKPKAWDLADGWPTPRPMHVQPKHDGWRLDAYMQGDVENGLCVFGRKREAALEYSHLLDGCEWYRKLAKFMPPMSHVSGELWVPGSPASQVVSAMTSAPEKLVFTPFAVPSWMGRGYAGTMDDARRLVEEKLKLPFVRNLPFQEYTAEDFREMFPGSEGVVLKHAHLRGWFKVKWEQTVDLVVMDVKPGDKYGKYAGMAGSLHGGVWDGDELVEVACCSGMDDELRKAISLADRGRVFECRFQYVGEGGRLRHPRFIRWRDDKPVIECGKEQLA